MPKNTKLDIISECLPLSLCVQPKFRPVLWPTTKFECRRIDSTIRTVIYISDAKDPVEVLYNL